MEPDRQITDVGEQADEPLFGLAVPSHVRAETLTRYLQEADDDDVGPFSGWAEHVHDA